MGLAGGGGKGGRAVRPGTAGRGPDGAGGGRREGRKGSAAGDGGKVSEPQSPRLRPEVLLDGAEPPSATPVTDATGAAPPSREDEAAPVARGGQPDCPALHAAAA